MAAKLIEAVKSSGVETTRISTSGLSVDPQFDERDEADIPAILGYIARNDLTIELANIAEGGRLVSLLFEQGGNRVNGPYFGVRDELAIQRRAERQAIAQSREEAENYAEALNMRMVQVTRVFDRKFRDEGSNRSIIVTGSRIADTPIEPGTLTYTATIHAEYLLAPR